MVEYSGPWGLDVPVVGHLFRVVVGDENENRLVGQTTSKKAGGVLNRAVLTDKFNEDDIFMPCMKQAH